MKRLALAVIGLALLAGCGVKGGLERPDPMWNRGDAVAREQQQLREQQELAARRAGQSAAPTGSGTEPNGATEPLPQPH